MVAIIVVTRGKDQAKLARWYEFCPGRNSSQFFDREMGMSWRLRSWRFAGLGGYRPGPESAPALQWPTREQYELVPGDQEYPWPTVRPASEGEGEAG